MQKAWRFIACLLGAGFLLLAASNAHSTESARTQYSDNAAADGKNGAQSGVVRDLPLSGGAQRRVLYARPASPRGTIVMLPGGAGDVGIDTQGDLEHGKNFVV